jgi:hypothetical protein
VQQVPQLITITWDDGVTPVAYDIVQQITGGFQQRNGCPVPSTFYATVISEWWCNSCWTDFTLINTCVACSLVVERRQYA